MAERSGGTVNALHWQHAPTGAVRPGGRVGAAAHMSQQQEMVSQMRRFVSLPPVLERATLG